MPVWVSVGGFSAREYAETCDSSPRRRRRIELNLSCPNVDEAPGVGRGDRRRMPRGDRKPALRQAFSALVGHRRRPCARSRPRAPTASASSTRCAVSRSTRTLRPTLARGAGGYSGPALKPVALAAVCAARRVTDVADRRHGGVQTGRDALELIACGATHVALGTVLFADPIAPTRVRDELVAEAAERRFRRRRTMRSASRSTPLPNWQTDAETVPVARALRGW